MKTKTLLLSTILLLLIIPLKAALADGLVPCTDECTLCHLVLGIKNIFDFLLKLLLAACLLGITIAGVLYMVSAGSKGLIEKAKKAFTSSIIALVLLLCSWLVVNAVMNALGFKQAGSWSSFTCDTTQTTPPIPPIPPGPPGGSCADLKGTCRFYDAAHSSIGKACNEGENDVGPKDCPSNNTCCVPEPSGKCADTVSIASGMANSVCFEYGAKGRACSAAMISRFPECASKTCYDCSGFVSAVWKKAGVGSFSFSPDLDPYNFINKAHAVGSCEGLQVGDIIIKSGSGASGRHVQLYIGNGKVIHNSSSSSNPNPVKVSGCTGYLSVQKCKGGS